jgi:4-coumarate--CoA ligase
MPPNATMYTAKHNTCASCAPTISHNRSRPPTPPPDPPQCRSPHDSLLHNAYHALRNPRIQAQRTPPRTTHPHPPFKDYDSSSVFRFSSGAAPLSQEVIDLLAEKFPQTASGKIYGETGLKQGYGMTESCSCITAYPLHRVVGFEWGNAVGEIVANTEVKIIKEDGTEAGVNEAGEILARGPQITMGYLNNEKATRETYDADGFLHTGDQGRIDEHGMIWILDRIKEMIKVKGIQVAPAELEDLLLGHPKVEDVAVLGIPDDYSGELPKAFILLKPGVEKVHGIGKELI